MCLLGDTTAWMEAPQEWIWYSKYGNIHTGTNMSSGHRKARTLPTDKYSKEVIDDSTIPWSGTVWTLSNSPTLRLWRLRAQGKQIIQENFNKYALNWLSIFLSLEASMNSKRMIFHKISHIISLFFCLHLFLRANQVLEEYYLCSAYLWCRCERNFNGWRLQRMEYKSIRHDSRLRESGLWHSNWWREYGLSLFRNVENNIRLVCTQCVQRVFKTNLVRKFW